MISDSTIRSSLKPLALVRGMKVLSYYVCLRFRQEITRVDAGDERSKQSASRAHGQEASRADAGDERIRIDQRFWNDERRRIWQTQK